VAERLRQQIFARTLEPGSWIDEMKLAPNTASAARRCARR
jgi:DNA-binding GntR family transcriptional regulator